MYISHILYITLQKHSGTLSQVSCPLVASLTERDQHCDFVSPQGRFMAYSLVLAKVYMGEVSLLSTWMVKDLDSDMRALHISKFVKPMGKAAG